MTEALLDPLFVSVLVGTVLPILVGIVTKQVAHRGLKAVFLAALSAAGGVLAVAQTNGGLITKETVVFAFVTWVTAVATHYGFLKPTGVSDGVNNATKDFGVG